MNDDKNVTQAVPANCDGDGQCSQHGDIPRPRKRSLTSLTLQWFADRFKRAEQIKSEISEGRYSVDSEKVARALTTQDS